MFFGMFLVWGALIAVAIWGVSVLFPRGARPTRIGVSGNELTAREILDSRYAQGEISRQEYELMRHDIDPSRERS